MFIATDCFNKSEETMFDLYNIDFYHLLFTNGHSSVAREIMKSRGFEEMKELTAKLSKELHHARIDLYDVNGYIYFGEITFFYWYGLKPFYPIGGIIRWEIGYNY